MTNYSLPAGTTVRKAIESDAQELLALIDALAAYEKLDPPGPDAKQRLVRDIFGPEPRLEAYLCRIDGTAVGYALVLETYSSFLALPTLYLEDIFVLEEFRNRKAGLALYLYVAGLAKQRGCGRLDFAVLDWNTSAQEFYRKLGAKHLKEWFLFRMSADEIDALPGFPATHK